MIRLIDYIKSKKIGNVETDKLFKDITTLRIGGKIKLFFEPYSISGFLDFYREFKKYDFPLFVIGNGSNILASDEDYNGIVISFSKINIDYICVNNILTVSSGVKVIPLVYKLANNNLGGIEFLSGIPGTIGGVIAMNAGAYNKEIKDILIDATCIDTKGNIIVLKNHELGFEYRKSLIQEKSLIILNARLLLENRDKKEILEDVKKKKRNRQKNQPLKEKNAGCTFKNNPSYATWMLIDKIGFRGKEIGDAKISTLHTNFFINVKDAKAIDMYNLVRITQEEIKNKFNINLECEWILVNFHNNSILNNRI